MAEHLEQPRVITFGCRLNIYESNIIKEHAVNAGETNVIYINTCAVTSEAERQSKQAVRKAHRDSPNSLIVVTGCSAQLNPDQYAGMEGVSAVLGNKEKLDFSSYGRDPKPLVRVNDISMVKETAGHLVVGMEDHARAFVEVQNGCDHRCTFCIIPYARGASRSVAIGAIAHQLEVLVANGYNEVVFTGVDLTSFGGDLPGKPTLGQMIRRVLARVPTLKRLRLSSVDPAEIDDDLWMLIEKEPRLMPHIHMSMQSGDDMILKRMKRRHLRQDILNFVQRVRSIRPEVTFGADIIAGFPTESDAQFENTLSIIDECDIAYCHVFPYSAREGTPAARIPQDRHVPVAERKRRAGLLRAAGARRLNKLYERMVGQTVSTIAERAGVVRAPNFVPISVENGEIKPGQIHSVCINGRSDKGNLVGNLV